MYQFVLYSAEKAAFSVQIVTLSLSAPQRQKVIFVA